MPADGFQLFFDLAVAALDVAAGIIHQRLAFGAEPRQDQRRARAQIRCANRRAGQIRRALHDGDAVFHPNVRAQPGKLGGMHEAVFKNRFQKYACAGGFAGDGHHRRLQIGREAGINHRADFKGLFGSAEDHQPARRILDMYARFAELEEQGAQMFRPRAGKQQFAAGDGAGAGHRV